MKIKSVQLCNFRQFYGTQKLDLTTSVGRNIVLIGAKNGFGKTNLLLGIVWCLYGEKISLVDEGFKKEIRKETNYQKFMKRSLNWTYEQEGGQKFSLQLVIEIDDKDFQFNTGDSKRIELTVTRSFNANTTDENFSIVANDESLKFSDEDEKFDYINDNVIPLEAAKFVFFDAEKIASWAELSIKKEGSVFNDAFGKLIGLDIYESLIEDLSRYSDELRKEGAQRNDKEEIINTEKAIDLIRKKIEDIDDKIAQNENTIIQLKTKVREYDEFLNQKNLSIGSKSKEELTKKKHELSIKETKIRDKFIEISELIPLAILTGTLEEINEHLELQDVNNKNYQDNSDLRNKFERFVEFLFNKPPEPENMSLSFNNKVFYAEKAKQLFQEIFLSNEQFSKLSFEHDLSVADRELLSNALTVLSVKSQELTVDIFNEINSTRIELDEINRKIKQLDADFQDELVLDFSAKKADAERKIERLYSENGGLNSSKDDSLSKLASQLNLYSHLLNKITVTKKNMKKIQKIEDYNLVLRSFVLNQKKNKKNGLANNILNELSKLMHKMHDDSKAFIDDVNVEILPDNTGLKVTIYNSSSEEIPKETLSQGEKQIYISALIKAMLMEAIFEFPIIIDTPLGRLDDEHIRNILLNYYPNLADQVIILSTNNEITPRREKQIEQYIASSYLIEYKNNKSSFKKGYFKSYEN